MSSKTKKIVVLHMKEIIYTAVFFILAILLIILLTVMFRPGKGDVPSGKQYTPGTYTSTLTLNNNALEVEVSVDENHINSIRFSNLDETITTMYPLIQPAMEDIAQQVCQAQSLENISLPKENPYTSQVIVDAISQALEKAVAN
ncbi:MAG: hypothetical protein PHN80_13640 [Hespellia sp.]|nr:hypothetical protein [Hespellia sp.]